MTTHDLRDLKQLAWYLQLHEDTVYKLVAGQCPFLPCYRIGRRWRWSKSRIDLYLNYEIQRQTAIRATVAGVDQPPVEE